MFRFRVLGLVFRVLGFGESRDLFFKGVMCAFNKCICIKICYKLVLTERDTKGDSSGD